MAVFCALVARGKPMLCITNATDGSAICFDGHETLTFSAEKFKQINSYDVIENEEDRRAAARRRRKRKQNF